MDKGKVDWSWLPSFMPGVTKLMAEKRKVLGNAHCNECWRRGVVNLEPGWFFAREGPLTVGTPWDDPVITSAAWAQITPSQVLLFIREPGHAA